MKLIATVLIFLTLSTAAIAGDSFSRAEIQNAMSDYYAYVEKRNPGQPLTEETRDRMTRAMARQLSVLPAHLFNDVMAHMLAIDYMQSVQSRPAIQELVRAVEEQGRAYQLFETLKDAKTSAILTVISDAFLVWSLIYAKGFIQGWGGGQGLQNLERFNVAMKTATESMPKALSSKLALTGIGTAAGAAHAAFDYLYRTRFDPMEMLQKLQEKLVADLAMKAARYRRTLQSGGRETEQSLEASQKDLEEMKDGVIELAQDVPGYRGRVSPIAEDISVSLELVQHRVHIH